MHDENNGSRAPGLRDRERPLASNESSHGVSVMAGAMVSKGYKPLTSKATNDRLEFYADKCRAAAQTITRLQSAMSQRLDDINERRSRFIRVSMTPSLGLSECVYERSGTSVGIKHRRGADEGIPIITDTIDHTLAPYLDAVLAHLTPVDSVEHAVAQAALELAQKELTSNV